MKTLEEDMHRTAWSSDEPEPADRLAILPSFWRNAISLNPLKNPMGEGCGRGGDRRNAVPRRGGTGAEVAATRGGGVRVWGRRRR